VKEEVYSFNFPFDAEILIPEREATHAVLRSKILERHWYEPVDNKVTFPAENTDPVCA
jgi:hypothetical protein